MDLWRNRPGADRIGQRPRGLLRLIVIVLLATGCNSSSPTAPECRGPFAPDFPGLVEPKKVFFPSPQYTRAAIRARVTGVVKVEGIVGCDGAYAGLRVVQSLPHGLDQAALDALAQWRFEPARLDGQAVSAHWPVSINFQLQ